MPKNPRRQYLFRDVESGKMIGNEDGFTARSALARFSVDHPEIVGTLVDVKARALPDLPDEDWERFSVD